MFSVDGVLCCSDAGRPARLTQPCLCTDANDFRIETSRMFQKQNTDHCSTMRRPLGLAGLTLA